MAASLSSPLLIFTELEVAPPFGFFSPVKSENLPSRHKNICTEITPDGFMQVKSSMATGEVFSYCYEVRIVKPVDANIGIWPA